MNPTERASIVDAARKAAADAPPIHSDALEFIAALMTLERVSCERNWGQQ